MQLILLSLAALLLGAWAGAPAARSLAPRQQSERAQLEVLRALETWRDLVAAHAAGEADESARAAGTLTRADLRRTLTAIESRRLSASEIKRGAMLHLDVALHVIARASGPLYRVPNPGTAQPGGATVVVYDGRREGQSAWLTHLEVGRQLLRRLPADAQRDEFVQLWYVTTAAALAYRRNFADLERHLAEGRELLPDDPELLLASACLHETFAAPRTQAIVRDPRHDALRISVGPESINLARAENYLRRAAEVAPRLPEVRLRLGRTLSLAGKHEEAAEHLRFAVEHAEDPEGRYFALLFLGRSLEARGVLDRAAAFFADASALFPHAQSPHLALSRLALARGDQDEAARVLSGYADSTPAPSGDDPWWRYYDGPGRHAHLKAAALRAAVEALPR